MEPGSDRRRRVPRRAPAGRALTDQEHGEQAACGGEDHLQVAIRQLRADDRGAAPHRRRAGRFRVQKLMEERISRILQPACSPAGRQVLGPRPSCHPLARGVGQGALSSLSGSRGPCCCDEGLDPSAPALCVWPAAALDGSPPKRGRSHRDPGAVVVVRGNLRYPGRNSGCVTMQRSLNPTWTNCGPRATWANPYTGELDAPKKVHWK